MKRGKIAKEKRQQSAEQCRQKRNKRTDTQQLSKLDNEGRTAKKERARLTHRIKDSLS